MNVLITGSSGFIGSALARRFSGSHTVGLDIALHPGDHNCTHGYRVDVSDKEELSRALRDVRSRLGPRLDCVFHLAAYYDFLNKKNPLYEKVNEGGTRNLLEALDDFEVGTFIFTSSTAAMKGLDINSSGIDTGHRLTETSPLGSRLEYGESKRRAEEIATGFKDRTKVFIVRLAGVYALECRLIPLAHQIATIHKKDLSSWFLPGGGRGCISYVHVNDVLDGLERMVKCSNEIPSGSVYIISEEDYLSYAELYGLIYKDLHRNGGDLRPISLPGMLLRGGVCAANCLSRLRGHQDYFFKPWMVNHSLLRYCFDTGKAKRELGWQANRLLRHYIHDILGELKRDPERWFEVNNIHF